MPTTVLASSWKWLFQYPGIFLHTCTCTDDNDTVFILDTYYYILLLFMYYLGHNSKSCVYLQTPLWLYIGHTLVSWTLHQLSIVYIYLSHHSYSSTYFGLLHFIWSKLLSVSYIYWTLTNQQWCTFIGHLSLHVSGISAISLSLLYRYIKWIHSSQCWMYFGLLSLASMFWSTFTVSISLLFKMFLSRAWSFSLLLFRFSFSFSCTS